MIGALLLAVWSFIALKLRKSAGVKKVVKCILGCKRERIE